MDVNQLNIETAVFLKRLRLYSEQKNVQINEKTGELLLAAVDYIDKLIANADMVSTTEPDNVNFIFDLNDQQFDLRQYIMCRLCVVSYENFFFIVIVFKYSCIIHFDLGTNWPFQG